MAHSETVTAEPWSTELEHNRDWLERVILSRVGSRDALVEVLQEVGLAVAKSEGRPEAASDFAPWLCRIAIRQCAQYLRRCVRQTRLIQDYAQALTDVGREHELDPLFGLMQAERQRTLQEAIGGLPEDLRRVLLAKYFDRLSYQQISEQLGISEHAVEYRLVEARRRLRAALAQWEDSDE